MAFFSRFKAKWYSSSDSSAMTPETLKNKNIFVKHSNNTSRCNVNVQAKYMYYYSAWNLSFPVFTLTYCIEYVWKSLIMNLLHFNVKSRELKLLRFPYLYFNVWFCLEILAYKLMNYSTLSAIFNQILSDIFITSSICYFLIPLYTLSVCPLPILWHKLCFQ